MEKIPQYKIINTTELNAMDDQKLVAHVNATLEYFSSLRTEDESTVDKIEASLDKNDSPAMTLPVALDADLKQRRAYLDELSDYFNKRFVSKK